MKYSITKLNDNNYDLYGIKLDNGSKCIYWSNKDVTEYNEVIVIFDNKNVINVEDGQVCISLNGVTDREDATDMINAFGRELYKDDINITKINFKFIIDNRDEEEIANKIMDVFRLDGDIIKSDKYSYLTENLDDALSNISIKVPEKNDEIIEKVNIEEEILDDIDNDDNSLLSRESKNEDILEDGLNETLDLSNVRKQILKEWLNDPVKREEISSLSREELGKMLLNATESYNDNNIINKKDDYDIDVDNKVVEDNKKEDINEFIKTNKKPVLDSNSFNKSNLVRDKDSLKTNKDSSIMDKSVDESFWDDDIGLMDAPVSRKSNNNSLNKKNTGKVKVLKKPKTPVYPRNNKKQSTFISVPIIIFIISFLLLIGSIIVLFLMK